MIKKIQYIWILLCLLMSSQMLFAQQDSLFQSKKLELKENLNQITKLYFWDDESFRRGKVKLKTLKNIEEEFQKLNSPVFSEWRPETREYYSLFEHLNTHDKGHLVRYFSYYENSFIELLKGQNLPEQIKYLPVSMTVLNTKAAHGNKVGAWQLSHFQGVLNGLTISELVDERYNIEYASEAAIPEIKQNLNVFKNIDLAILAFWYGRTKIKNLISRCQCREVEKIIEFLPDAKTKIAMFQATLLFLYTNKFSLEFDIQIKEKKPDIAKVNRQMHFQQISRALDIDRRKLEQMNPQFIKSIIPGDKREYKLALPAGKWDDFVLWQDSINSLYDSTLFEIVSRKIEYPPPPTRQYVGEKVKNLEIEGKTKIRYQLKTGDVLGIIAEKYDVRVADLKYWNNISNERRIQAGKTVDIFVDNDKADYYLSLNLKKQQKEKETAIVEQIKSKATQGIYKEIKSAKKVEHIVKSGESPYIIAKKYEGVTPDEILEWNNIMDARKIQIGQKLIIYLKNETN